MEADRWKQVDRLLQSALEHPPAERGEFLRRACGEDAELEREVRSLLTSQEQAGSFLESPAIQLAAQELAGEQSKDAQSADLPIGPTLRPTADSFLGRTVSNYRLEERLAAGGMGVLYRATDLKLGRSVAVKVLSRQLAPEETAKARLLREARAASALDHPNIGAIHHIEEQDGELFIIMALYQGETLKQRLKKGPLPVGEALQVLRQMALGLEAAHRAGIVHRDIKPANVLRTDDGIVKILDFGLAKLTSDSQAATAVTQTGETMGTVPYMSPEQLRGQAVDVRSDLWSFGVVAYELLAGVTPFQADSSAATAMRILNEEPPPLAGVSGVPDWLGELITQLLRKAPGERPQSAGEVLSRLDRPSSPSRSRPKSRPVLLASAILAGVGRWRDRFFGSSAAASIRSLAVLPLDNFSRDPEQEYFADGMTEELIANLAKISSLRVISRTSVMRYKGARKPLPEIARELNVDVVLEGSVRREGERVRITAQLIHGPTERHLWAESYERDWKQVLRLESEVALAIANEIKVRLSPDEQTRLGSARQVNPQAHEAYLKGVYYLDKFTVEGTKKSLEYFERAIQIDPGFAPAYAGLSLSYGRLTTGGLAGQHGTGKSMPPKEGFPKLEAAARKALELDPTLALPHAMLAWTRWVFHWNWAEAEREFKLAIQLHPNDAKAHQWYSHYLLSPGRVEEAIAEMKRALELDPVSLPATANFGLIYVFAGQYEQGTKEYRKALEMDPNYAHARFFLAFAYLYQGMYDEALREFRKYSELIGGHPDTDGSLALYYAFVGNREDALKSLAILQRRDVSPRLVAVIYARLGDKDQAFNWLEKAYEEHDPMFFFLNVNPMFQPLHSDPRFQDLLRRIGLPQ